MSESKSSAKPRRVHYLQLVGPEYQPCDEPGRDADAPSAGDALTDIEMRLRFAVGTVLSLSSEESVESCIADALCGAVEHLRHAQGSLERLYKLKRLSEGAA